MTPSNVLLFLPDEHNPWVAGFLGHPCVRTPNLDALAASGTVFTRAWTPSPICVPARASLATGRYVHEHRCWDNALAYDGSQRSWMQELTQAGVLVDSIGKLHFAGGDSPVGFRQQIEAVHIDAGIGQVWGSVRNPLPERSGLPKLFDRMGAGESDYNRFDARVTDAACAWLREHSRDTKPWALFVGLVAPHFPLVVPQRHLDRVLADPSLEACLPSSIDQAPHHPWVARMIAFQDFDAALGSDERRRLAVACYLALVEFMDERLGEVLATLRATGLVETTRVIFTSDHGDNLGARRLWNKGTLYRESTGVPMVIAGPSVSHGHRCETNVSLVDLYPSLVEAATGQLPQAPLPGGSLWSIGAAPHDPGRLAFSEYHAVGSPSGAFLVADGRHVYHHYVGYPPALFDWRADPRERNDLAGDPAHAATLERMREALYGIVDPEAADRVAKQDQDRLVARFGGREAALNRGVRGATPVPGK